jgi:SEC-C motif
MKPVRRVGPNDPCPCLTGKKYKHCCRGKIDWEQILRSGRDYTDLISVRGRNLMFVEAIQDALQLDKETSPVSLEKYKKAFTADAVRKIYEAVCDLWHPHTDIQSLLERAGADVSGLYIGDYDHDYVKAALVRHSIYANKILLVAALVHLFSFKSHRTSRAVRLRIVSWQPLPCFEFRPP